MMTVAAAWKDLWAPLILAGVGGGVALFWPWLQTYWRGLKFQGIIKRELEELAPYPQARVANAAWWEHLSKRFVHEEVFAREKISANRDFLLSLNPDVVYKVSQLWAAYEKRDAHQWLHFLHALAHDSRVGSPRLLKAHGEWLRLLEDGPSGQVTPRIPDCGSTQYELLFDARLAAYGQLLGLTRYGPEEQPLSLSAGERERRAEELMDWHYEGGGLLLSSEAFVAFRSAHARLTDETTDKERWLAFSALRTELKIDLGVRHVDTRHVEKARIT